MATQVMGQASGGGGLFPGSGNIGMALSNDMYDLHDLSKAELAAPQLIMLANVALTGEVNGSCCDYLVGEERQMAELMPVGDNNFSDSDGEGLEESPEIKGEPSGLGNVELQSLELSVVEPQPVFEVSAAPEVYSASKEVPPEAPGAEDKCKNLKTKPFRCKPCQYEAESEEQFVHHIRVHSAKKFFVEESAEKQAKARESGASTGEEGDFSKGPIRCDRCGYNTNRYDHYTAHLKHHTRAGDNERVYKCIICTYTTVSEYHWRKHLRNHFPRKVYTCGKCNYFSDRKNNYVQHVRTHTGERPYKCELCHYSSSQKTHLTRHMRTHSGEKPFKCDQCSYVASNQHEVTRHARQVHNGPKPLNCPHCDYKTADRSNFKKHVELHVNPRQFNCPVCDYAASKKCNLQYHFKSKHPTCPNKTMDVSKVKLKKTKKREADLPSNNNAPSEKPETEQAKIKGDVAGKKNEKSLKAEKRDVSKEKKPGHAPTQVTTRTRKSALEAKEPEPPPRSHPEKSCKTKKSKRKLEAEAQPCPEPAPEQEPAVKKKKKAESKPKNSQEAPKAAGKVEETKKPKRSAKKKPLKGKSGRKGSKPAPKGPAQKEAAEWEPEPEPEPVPAPAPREPEPSAPEPPALPAAPLAPAPAQPPAEAPMDGGQDAPAQMEPPPPPPSTEPVPRKSPRKESRKEKPSEPSQMPRKEQVLGEVGLVPVKESAAAPPAPDGPRREAEVQVAREQEAEAEAQIAREQEARPEGAQGQGTPGEVQPAAPAEPQPQPAAPPSAVPHAPVPADDPEVDADMEVDAVESQAQNDPASTAPAPEPGSPPTPPLENGDGAAKRAAAPPPAAATTGATDAQEMDEDEGIHSHDGSDLSDNMSEGSDDSGLNGARPVPPDASEKSAPDDDADAAAAGPGKGGAAGAFVCIFCDRSFRKEKDYSKHLNRHLVNVYFLEKAAKGQE
ncbi:RE1-silencing transcription factor [Sorex fumeus]|uniref:RE1-silencing transcription factor n=1 Tax=Sorex fumeus TaxID=62283 RepID=UPI0024AE320C|nr:RE1-silencing transcription factor [Sorex fumeus]